MSLSALFNRWKKNKILVVGDFMLDTYTMGSAKRISPEAPVMVVNAKKINKLPGGAGNVALNLVSLGASVVILGRVGDDSAKEDLLELFKSENINTQYLYTQKGYQTPIKNRIMAGNHQIVRIDFEEKNTLSKNLEQQIIDDLPIILKGVSTVALSDYAKGFLSDKLIRAIIQEANGLGIPVIVDPKGRDFSKYSGAHLIKPNYSEALQASGCDEETNLEVVANSISQATQIPHVMITRSSAGISVFSEEGSRHYPVKVREVVDVTGAGDTVLATLTFALSNKIGLHQATILANLAAGEVIEHLGCARIAIKRLAELILKQHLDNKVFSEQYLKILQFILDHEAFILIKLTLKDNLSPKLFVSLKELREKHLQEKLVIYLEEEPEDEALLELLSSLTEVDFIIKKSKNLQKFCEKHKPTQIYDFCENTLRPAPALSELIEV